MQRSLCPGVVHRPRGPLLATAWGLSVGSVPANRMLVPITGSSHAIATALHTGFATYTAPVAGTYFQLTRDARRG